MEPHWDKGARRGRCIRERVFAWPGARVSPQGELWKIRSQRARSIFIEGALVAGEFESSHPFWAHNRKLILEIEDLEHRARRPDVLVDDRALFAFYDAKMPGDIRDSRTFDTWYRAASAKEPRLLFLAREDLMRHGAESVTEELFPRHLHSGDAVFPLAYRFEPTHPMDGVTINVPLALLNQVDDVQLDWLVPGMVREKVGWTMKALPKRIRSQLIPVPEHTTKLLEGLSSRMPQSGDGPGSNVRQAVLDYASRIVGERLDDSIWSKDDPPTHLLMNIRVIDDAKRELAMGRDLNELRKRLGEAASLTLAKAQPAWSAKASPRGISATFRSRSPSSVATRRSPAIPRSSMKCRAWRYASWIRRTRRRKRIAAA